MAGSGCVHPRRMTFTNAWTTLNPSSVRPELNEWRTRRPSPRLPHGWQRFLLRLFGAKIGKGVHVDPGARVWAPWNLEMADHSSLADDVDCYSVERIRLGEHAVASQYSFLCTASHDETDPRLPLTTAPIAIGSRVWIAADVFLGPGVTLGEGAMAGVRSSIFKDVPSWTVVVGTPARPIRRHVMRDGGAGPVPVETTTLKPKRKVR